MISLIPFSFFFALGLPEAIQSGGASGAAFSLAHPQLLWGLLLLPLIAWLQGKQGGAPSILFPSKKLWEGLGKQRRHYSGAILMTILYGAMALLIVALSGPRSGRSLQHINASGVDIMLVLDVSGSMIAEDYHIGETRVSRLDAVKKVTEDFIRARPYDRIGIVAFARRPYLVSPITLDHDWLIKNLDRIKLGLVDDGTAIGSSLAMATSRLKDKEGKTKLIVLLTDGVNNAGKVTPRTAAEATHTLGLKVYTVGAGSNGPAPVPAIDPFGRKVYQTMESEFDEKLLQDIANRCGGKYFRAADTQALERTFQEIDHLEKTPIKIEHNVDYTELFRWFVGAALLLLLLEIILSKTIWRRIP
jgi:Ca-activated chloride channel homolog